MNYENKVESLNQEIKVKDRKKVELTGVKKIESLNNKEFVVNTNLGLLTVKGENLEMQHLEIEKGILWIGGAIDSLIYDTSDKKTEKKTSFLGKVFKWFIQLKKKFIYQYT